MAIALVTSGKEDTSTGSSSTVTIPLTVSGSDTVLLVFATSVNTSDRLTGGSATWNGGSMGSPIATITSLSNHYTYAWLLVAPTAGSFNVVVTANANSVFCAGAIVLSGVDQSTPVSTTAGIGIGSPSSPVSNSITVPSGGWAVDWFGARANGATITPDGSQTQIGTPATIDFNGQYGASYKEDATAMQWTYTGSPNVTHMRVALNPASGGDTTAPILSSPTGTQTGSTTATIGATTDEANGTLYGYVSASATPPSDADLKAGTGAVWAGSASVSGTGANTLNATGLTASTGYYAHLLHTDAAANDSNTVTSAQFTTASGASGTVAKIIQQLGY
jgi:hypothetical protein